jgi:hypothetical protein
MQGISDAIVLLDGGELEDSSFRNSRIIFTNDAVKLKNVTFINCVFDFTAPDNPSPYLKSTTKELLLASNLNSVTITVL